MPRNLFRLSLPALACAAAIFTGSVLGAFFAGTSAEAREHAPAARRDDAPDVLAHARERLETILETEPLSQLEMTMASAEIRVPVFPRVSASSVRGEVFCGRPRRKKIHFRAGTCFNRASWKTPKLLKQANTF